MSDIICGALGRKILWGTSVSGATGCSGSIEDVPGKKVDAGIPDSGVSGGGGSGGNGIGGIGGIGGVGGEGGGGGDGGSGICDDKNPSNSPQIAWLKNQIGKTGLVDSDRDDGTDDAYLYDQALAAIAFTQAGEICEAQGIFEAIAFSQNPNGGWYTCYSAEKGSACELYVHTGPIAWVVMAVNFYETKTGDAQFVNMANSAIAWMNTMRNIDPGKDYFGSLKYGEGDSQTKISTEHNHDANSAYYYRAEKEKAEAIKTFLINEMWAPSPESNGPDYDVNIFWRGYNDFAWCTDPQSWGVLSLGPDYAKSLEWLDSKGDGNGSTKITRQGVTGFSFCTEDVNPPNGENPNFCGKLFVWLEGTEGVAAAYYSAGNKEKGKYYHDQTAKVLSPGGGIPYSIADADDPIIIWPCNWPYESVASTAWYYFNEAKINPFRPY